MATPTNATISRLSRSSVRRAKSSAVDVRQHPPLTHPDLDLDSGQAADEQAPSVAPNRRPTRRPSTEALDISAEIGALEAVVARASSGDLAFLMGQFERLRAIALVSLISARSTEAKHDADENLSAKEAARRLGVSADWLYKANVPFKVRIGSRVLFSAAGLEKWNRQRSERL